MITLLPLLLALLLLPGQLRAAEVSVTQFSPQGTTKEVRQVTARFSEQMVPFGEPRALEPFEINCPEKGSGKWIDGRTWVFDFKADLPAGITCTFSLKKGTTALSGRAVSGPGTFSFSTGGPAVRTVRPRDGSAIAEDQMFALVLDAEATDESVLRNAYFMVKDVHERLPVRLVAGEARAQVLKAIGWDRRPEQITIVQCPRRFPNGGDVALVWGGGIAAKSGATTTEAQIFRFKVREAFTARVRCMRESPKAACIPLLPFHLDFSAPIPRSTATQIALKLGTAVYRPDPGDDGSEWVNRVTFKGPFPEKAELVLTLPPDLKDDSGRALSNRARFPLVVKTAGYPPLAKFSARFGILETAHPYLPVTVRNLEPALKGRTLDLPDEPDMTSPAAPGTPPSPSTTPSKGKLDLVQNLAGKVQSVTGEAEIIRWLQRIAWARRETSIFAPQDRPSGFSMPAPSGGKAFEVVGIPVKKNGFHVVELESTLLGTALMGKPRPMYVSAAAVVTNLSAHFKTGKENSLVWVTTLDTAKPVPGATVTIRNALGAEVWRGKTDERGIAMISGPLKALDQPVKRPRGQDNYAYYEPGPLAQTDQGLFAFVRTKDDMTFVHSSWTEGIEPWQFKLSYGGGSEKEIVRTIFDRTLFRKGETVHMKHVARRLTLDGFALLKQAELPEKLVVEHVGTNQQWELRVVWDASRGVAENSWTIPADARLGVYRVSLSAQGLKQGHTRGDGDGAWPATSGSFRVEDFRVPLVQGVIQPLGEPLVNASEVKLDLQVNYLSGGGAADLPVRLRGHAVPRTVTFEDYPDVVFSNGPVKPGITKRADEEIFWDEDELQDTDESEQAPRPAKKEPEGLQKTELKLSGAGAARATLKGNPAAPTPQQLITELEFSDPNGEIVTVSRNVPMWPSAVLVGVSPDSWALSPEILKFQVVTVDLKGDARQGVPVKVELLQRKSFSHRKRLVGGFYSYEHTSEVVRAGALCEGTTDARGLLFCEVRSPVKGNAILQATATDGAGNPTTAHADVWIGGEEEWWFKVGDTDRIDLLPEKKRYEPGETARMQARMPYREATVLMTVERDGIIDAFVERVSGMNPVLQLPVKGSYSPNVYVSALCVRGRVAEPKPTALVDLGKPSFKLGIAEISVGWGAHELKVSVQADRESYRVREKARVKVKVTKADGGILPRGGEVAVAVVDEGLLELKPNTSWQLLEQMMQRRAYDVLTSTAQMQVVGKRHYGRKALPPGGGGGRHPTRELFDTLVFWQGRMNLDDNGEAVFDFPLKDALSSFRVVAVATVSSGLFGTGAASVRTTQELMMLAGLPRVVRQGDRFRAEFTVRNASERPMEVEISARLQQAGAPLSLRDLSEELKAGEARVVGWDVTVEKGAESLRWEVEAREKKGSAGDSLKVSQSVVPLVPVRVVQATLSRLEKPIEITVEPPRDAVAGAGGVGVGLAPSIAGGTEAIRRYMKAYQYTCLEQRVSRAIALRDEAAWKSVMADLPSLLDESGLARYFPDIRLGSDVLTAYLLSIAHEAGWQMPAGPREKMLGGLADFVEGRVVRNSSYPVADLTIRKLAALDALARYGKFDRKLLDPLAIDPNLWPTSAVIDWISLLGRTNLPERAARLKQAEEILRSRITMRGTVMTFSTEKTDCLWRNMVSVDLNAIRTVLLAIGLDAWNEDAARLMRGALSRQTKGRWDTTLANAWGIVMLEKFSKRFEAQAVTGESSASLGREKKSVSWAEAPGGRSLLFGWPRRAELLSVTHTGNGVPWVQVQSLAAVPLSKPLFSGYSVKKEYTGVQQKQPGVWSRGDVVRVRLDLEAQSDMTWVVVNDPVPSGSSILGTGLGRDSRILTATEDRRGWVRPVFEERSFESFRAYYQYVPKGTWSLEYTFRVNNPGTFSLPETRVEALYAPEAFGELPNKAVEVRP